MPICIRPTILNSDTKPLSLYASHKGEGKRHIKVKVQLQLNFIAPGISMALLLAATAFRPF